MDPALELEARRLFISTALTMYTARTLRGLIPADSGREGLIVLAHQLADDVDTLEHRYGLYFDPPYPGVSTGVESAGDSLRLVMACKASGEQRKPLGIAFTTLIPGRRPLVSVAPREAGIPEGWRPLGDLR